MIPAFKSIVINFVIVFIILGCRDKDATTEEITSEENEKEETAVNKEHGADDYGPAISPDGSRILFYSTRGNSSQGRIFSMNIDGSALVEIPYENTGGHDVEPKWSPDGKQIAFTSQRNFNDEGGVSSSIYIMNADGTELKLLYDHDGDDDGATHFGEWNEEGDGFVFFYWKYGGFEPNIYYINTDGSGLAKLTSDNASYQPSLRNNRVWYSSSSEGDTNWYSVLLNGQGKTKIDELIDMDFDVASVFDDGFYFCKLQEEEGSTTLYKMDHEENSVTELTTIKLPVNYFFDVSHDQKYMVFNSAGMHNMDIYKLDLKSGETFALVADN